VLPLACRCPSVGWGRPTCRQCRARAQCMPGAVCGEMPCVYQALHIHQAPHILTLLLSGLQVRPAPGQCPTLPDPPLRGQHWHLQCTQGECSPGSPGMVPVEASCQGFGWFPQGMWRAPLDLTGTDQPRACAESCCAGHCRGHGGAGHPMRHRGLCLAKGKQGMWWQDETSDHHCSSPARA